MVHIFQENNSMIHQRSLFSTSSSIGSPNMHIQKNRYIPSNNIEMLLKFYALGASFHIQGLKCHQRFNTYISAIASTHDGLLCNQTSPQWKLSIDISEDGSRHSFVPVGYPWELWHEPSSPPALLAWRGRRCFRIRKKKHVVSTIPSSTLP